MSRIAVYPKLRLVRDKTKDGIPVVWFSYRLSADVGFKFSTLGECRDDVAKAFRQRLEDRGLGYEQIEIAQAPWIVTRVWKLQLTPRQLQFLLALTRAGCWTDVGSVWHVGAGFTRKEACRILSALVQKKYVSLSLQGRDKAVSVYSVTAAGHQYVQAATDTGRGSKGNHGSIE